MDALTVVAAAIIVLLLFLGIFIFVDLAAMPGRIAHKRGHPHPDAVNILGIVGMLVGGVLWPVALTWAFFTPDKSLVPNDELDARIASLEERLTRFETTEAEASK